MDKPVQLDSKALQQVVDFAVKRFRENSKYSEGKGKEPQARLICAGLHDYLCSMGVDPGFEIVLPLDIEHSSLEDL